MEFRFIIQNYYVQNYYVIIVLFYYEKSTLIRSINFESYFAFSFAPKKLEN